MATVGCLAAALGWIPLSGLVVGGTGAVLAGALLRRPEVGLLLVPIWIVAGAVMVTGPGQWFLVRLARCRRPTPDEWDRLAAAWREVTEAAGVGGGHYRLWVQPSERLNAFAAIGKIVAVTSHAVAFLPHRQLAAVLAHELGHHLAGHAWSRALTYWCALPARYAGRGVRGFARAIRYLAGGSDGALLVAVLLGGAAALAAVFMAAALMLAVAAVAGWWWLLLGAAQGLLLAGRGFGGAERRADEIAVSLGYGPDLLAALVDAHPHTPKPVQAGVRLLGQRSLPVRQRRLEKWVGERR